VIKWNILGKKTRKKFHMSGVLYEGSSGIYFNQRREFLKRKFLNLNFQLFRKKFKVNFVEIQLKHY
jgi:hypothetical protein